MSKKIPKVPTDLRSALTWWFYFFKAQRGLYGVRGHKADDGQESAVFICDKALVAVAGYYEGVTPSAFPGPDQNICERSFAEWFWHRAAEAQAPEMPIREHRYCSENYNNSKRPNVFQYRYVCAARAKDEAGNEIEPADGEPKEMKETYITIFLLE